MLPWFDNGAFPLYLAPMAGVTDCVFRTICKELGADVMVTEFVSAEGIIREDERTRKYTEFTEAQRPVGVQLFGADGRRMAEAARRIIDRKRPDFIDLNFGCPVNKVVARNGGSSLLKNCPVLAEVARTVASSVEVPVTAKIRTGWDQSSVNAPAVARILEDCGISAITVHGRTRAQGYSGEADWEVIAACAAAVSVPVVGNGDIASARDVESRRRIAGLRGVMIGRAAMQHPWIFREARDWLARGAHPEPVPLETRCALVRRHCVLAIADGRYGDEAHTLQAMRSRLMAYSKGLPGGKQLRARFSAVASLAELDDIFGTYLASRIALAA